MFFSIFIHFNSLFQTITQSSYVALSPINNRRRNNYKGASAEGSRGGTERERTAGRQRGRWAPKKF